MTQLVKFKVVDFSDHYIEVTLDDRSRKEMISKFDEYLKLHKKDLIDTSCVSTLGLNPDDFTFEDYYISSTGNYIGFKNTLTDEIVNISEDNVSNISTEIYRLHIEEIEEYNIDNIVCDKDILISNADIIKLGSDYNINVDYINILDDEFILVA